jgi:hypothetical protein
MPLRLYLENLALLIALAKRPGLILKPRQSSIVYQDF